MKVKRIIFREMGEYNDMPIRPFNTDFDSRKIDILAEATDDGRQLSASSLAGISVGMLRPSSKSHGTAPIVSGWGEQRLMFLMEVEIHSTPTTVVTEVISGYTDHLGVSAFDSRKIKLDDQMRLYFNSAFNVRSLLAQGSRGREWKGNIYDSAQVVTRNKVSNLSQYESTGTMTMRPEDIITRNNVSSEFRELAGSDGFRDTRAEFDRRALKFSRRSNTQSATYLSATLSALRDSDDDDFLDNKESVRLADARGKVRERMVSNDRVFEEFAEDTAIMQDGFVTWGELCSMNRELNQIADVFMADKRTSVHRRSDSENWGGSDNETLAATIVANTIPAFLIDSMYADIEFTCTNDTRGGLYETVIGTLIPFVADTDVDENYNYLISRIEHELMPEILFNKQMTVFLHVTSSLYGDTTVNIFFDNGEEARFVFPTFCDSAASPIITNSREVIDVMAHDISEIHRQLREVSSARSTPSRSTIKRHI